MGDNVVTTTTGNPNIVDINHVLACLAATPAHIVSSTPTAESFTSFTLRLTSNDYEEEPYEITINSIMRSFSASSLPESKEWTSGMDLNVKYYLSWNHGQVGHNAITFSNPSGLTLLDKDDNPKTTWNGSAVISSSNSIFVTFTSDTSTLDFVTES